MTKRQLAKKYQVSLTTIDAWLLKDCPHTRGRSGRYHFNAQAVDRWRAETMLKASDPGAMSLNEARRRKEAALAELRELQLRVRRDELVERRAVEAQQFRIGRQVRDQLENIPPRLCGILAAETDQHKVFNLLMREIRQTLEDLTNEETDQAKKTIGK